MADGKVYDPDQVVIMFASVPIRGFADGTFLKLAPKNPAFTSKQGADGEVAWSKQNNRLWDVEFTLMQTSDSNDVLSAIHKLDLLEGNGAGIAPLIVTDTSGRFLFKSAAGRIIQDPDAEFGREAGDRVWKLEAVVAPGDIFHGGS